MLRIADTRTDRPVEIPAGHRHLLHICVHLPVVPTHIGPTDLRAPLVGDVLARTAELHGLQTLTVLTRPDLPQEQVEALDRAMASLGVHPPATVGAHEPTGTLGVPPSVHVLAPEIPADAVDGVRIDVGRVTAAPPNGGAPGPTDESAPEPAEPLAVRMLLLGHPYRTPVTVTPTALAEAQRALRQWRRKVSSWAQEPSKPIPAALLGQAHAALADDLDVPAVLDMLRSVERDADVPAGAKFETFAHLDRVLGLDLVSEVGHQRTETP